MKAVFKILLFVATFSSFYSASANTTSVADAADQLRSMCEFNFEIFSYDHEINGKTVNPGARERFISICIVRLSKMPPSFVGEIQTPDNSAILPSSVEM